MLTFNCVITLRLRRGQITLQGLVEVQGEDDPGPFEFAVTGGTRAFRSVGGEARTLGVGEGRSIVKLRLDFPKKKFGLDKKKPRKSRW